MGWRHFGSFSLLAGALLIGACAQSPSASPDPADASPSPVADSPTSAVATPPPATATPAPTASSPAHTPTATGVPGPTVQPTPSVGTTDRWELIDSETAFAFAEDPDYYFSVDVGAVAFDRGYVVHGAGNAYFSADGVSWDPVELPTGSAPCDEPGYDEDNLREAAGTGDAVLILGDYELADCRSGMQAFAWVSVDGQSWQRSEPFGSLRGESELDTISLWPVPGGWEVAIVGNDEEIELWRSTDGLRWTLATEFSGFGEVVGAAAADGTHLLSIYERLGSVEPIKLVPVLLARSDDGTTWSEIEPPHRRRAAGGVVTRVLTPGGAYDDPWVVVIDETDQEAVHIGTSAWSSSDLRDWQLLPNPDRWGTPCCGPSYPPLPGLVIGIADGPAGTIAVLADGRIFRLLR